jgi:chromosomal replication initiation ATPase DnaA
MKHPEEQLTGIILGVAKVYEVTPAQILGRNRAMKIAEARQVAMVIYRKSLSHYRGSMSRTAEMFHRDHGTVSHACHAVESRVMTDAKASNRWMKVRHLATEFRAAEPDELEQPRWPFESTRNYQI